METQNNLVFANALLEQCCHNIEVGVIALYPNQVIFNVEMHHNAVGTFKFVPADMKQQIMSILVVQDQLLLEDRRVILWSINLLEDREC
jgi:hypothetical protein